MPLECTVTFESWDLQEPFEISRGVMTAIDVLVVRLDDQLGHTGYGEAKGVPYKGETQQSMAAQIEAVAPRLHADLSGEDLMQLLPPGGARNALDCALWDLRAKQSGRRAWQLAGLPSVEPVLTTSATASATPSFTADSTAPSKATMVTWTPLRAR